MMLIKHLRDVNRRPFATVVALGPDQVGVSICNAKDEFDKKIGVRKAAGRARGQRGPMGLSEVPNRYVYFGWDVNGLDCPPLVQVIDEAVKHMLDRADRYFQ